MVELGLTEAAADGSHGAVVRSAMIKPPEVEELSLPGHVFSERFKTRPDGRRKKIEWNAYRGSKSILNVKLVPSGFLLDQGLGQLVALRLL